MIVKPFIKLNFYNFIFSIVKDASINIIMKTLFYLYSKSVFSFTLRNKRTSVIITL